MDAKTKKAWLALKVRYLYLDSDVKVEVDDSAETIQLEPRLGGVISGRIVLEGDAIPDLEALADSRVFIGTGRGADKDRGTSTPVSGTGTFEFKALRRGPKQVGLRSPHLLGKVYSGVKVRAGEVVDVRLRAMEGWQASGRITDSSGVPVPLASVQLWKLKDLEEGSPPFAVTFGRMGCKADQDGLFEVGNIPPAQIKIMVGAPGFALQVRRFGPSSTAESLRNLEFRLSKGSHIAGQVRWPDGSPAAGVTVRTTQLWDEQHFEPEEGPGQTREMTAKTDSEGAFEMYGFGSQNITVEVRGRQPSSKGGEPASGTPRSPKERSGPTLRCQKEDISPGTEGLLFVLE